MKVVIVFERCFRYHTLLQNKGRNCIKECHKYVGYMEYVEYLKDFVLFSLMSTEGTEGTEGDARG